MAQHGGSHPQEDAHEESKRETEDLQMGAEGAFNKELWRNPGRRPAEVEAGPVDAEEYAVYRSLTDLREPYRIPTPYLANTKKFLAPELPEAPFIVFINSKSGGRAGAKLTEVLYHTLGHAQVFDLQEYRPGPVLKRIWANLDAQEAAGDTWAPIVREKMRVLAAGGDGTVAWILKTIRELGLQPAPPVAVMPLGTGNDLSLSFGWGNAFLKSWINKHEPIYETLKRIGDAETRRVDTWAISLNAPKQALFAQLPHSLEPVSLPGSGRHTQDGARPEAVTKVKGLFWNYFSVGLDAQAAYGFHSLREKRPWATPTRTINQGWYSYYSCASGWFGPNAPPVRNTVVLKVRNVRGEWREVAMGRGIKALVLLNLQSYAGGRDLWGLRDPARDAKKGWRTPIFNDGLIEVVGLRNGWQTALVMAGLTTKIHAKRLAQGTEVVLELRSQGAAKGGSGETHMQLDGEPWPQAIPAGDAEPLTVHIKHAGTAGMLFNPARLHGIAPKIQRLASREHAISLRNEDGAGSREMGVLHHPPGPGPVQLNGSNQPEAEEDLTSSATSSPERQPLYARLASKIPIIREAPKVPVVPGVEEVDLEGEATPGRAATKGAGEGEKVGAAAPPATLESPERARPVGMQPPETPEQAAEVEPNLDTTYHSPVLDPGTPERPS